MRLGVLDVGSNTVHLLVVDAHRGGHPTPMSSTKATLRLAEATDSSGKITKRGADKLISTIDEFAKIAISSGCAELMAFATSAVRDAENSEDVLSRVRKETGVELQALRGEDESRLTFLAVRRWYGWSAGRILNLDIGGGSLEVSSGVDEEPEIALSLRHPVETRSPSRARRARRSSGPPSHSAPIGRYASVDPTESHTRLPGARLHRATAARPPTAFHRPLRHLLLAELSIRPLYWLSQ